MIDKSENEAKRPTRAYIVCIISVIIIVSVIIGGILWQISNSAQSNYEKTDVKIAFITANHGYNDVLYEKLNLDENIEIDHIKEEDVKSDTLDDYDIVIISNVDLKTDSRKYVEEYVNSSRDSSLIYLIDENTDGNDLKYLNITKNNDLPSFQGDNEIGYGICKNTEEQSKLTENVPWNSMPEIRNFTRLSDNDFYKDDAKDTSVILKDYSSEDSDDIYLFYKDLEIGGDIMVFTIWFDADLNVKEITESFPYTGYFFYSCFMFLEDKPIPSYDSWPYSPVPHLSDIIIFAVVFGGLAISSFVMFFAVYKYSRKHPIQQIEALETEEEIRAKEEAKEKIDQLRKESEGIRDEELEELESELESLDKEKFEYEEIEESLPDYLKGWESVGIHKQVGGFWTVFFLALGLILPLGGFFLWIYPAFIFPSPSGQGFYSFVVNFFGALWIFADLGTTVWMTRKFAAYRISEPQKAIQSAQCFVWFQTLSGAFQILFVGFLGAVGFPETIYAHLTFVFVWYSLFQWLGFFMVFVNILNSLQRVDVAGIGAAVLAPLFLIIQMAIVPIFIQIGSNDPSIGIALGGAVGSSIANFVTQLALFFAAWWIFRKTFGYSGNSIFRVDFKWDMFKDMLKFGLKYAPGQALVPLVWMLQVIMLSIYLDNYNNWLGYWNIAYTVAQISAIIGLFASSFIPALSEAKEHQKNNLVNYDIASMLRWTNHFSFWLHAALFAVGVPLILAITPPEFQAVAILFPLLIIFQLLGPYSWLGDAIFAGMDYPFYATLTWAIEQGARAILMILLIPIFAVDPRIGIFSIMFAYIPALLLKNIAVWALVKKKVSPNLKIYPFKTFIAPGIAGIVFYFIVFGLISIIGGGLIGAIITAAFALVAGPFVVFFLSGFFGGWSKNGLEEFKRSISIMTVVGLLGRTLFRCCSAGAKISPWREKGNMKVYNKARIEAWELTLNKKKLENI